MRGDFMGYIRSFRGLRPRTPGLSGLSAPDPELLFVRTKSNQKTAQGRDPFDGVPPLWIPPPRRHKGGNAPFGIPPASPTDCPGTPMDFTCAGEVNSPLRQGFCHLIYSGSINDASADALLKGEMFLLVLVETWFLKCNLGSIRRRIGYLKVLRRGDPMGGVPPLCRCGWGIFKGEGESKHPPP